MEVGRGVWVRVCVGVRVGVRVDVRVWVGVALVVAVGVAVECIVGEAVEVGDTVEVSVKVWVALGVAACGPTPGSWPLNHTAANTSISAMPTTQITRRLAAVVVRRCLMGTDGMGGSTISVATGGG